jgi:predicted Zn-dependent protease
MVLVFIVYLYPVQAHMAVSKEIESVSKQIEVQPDSVRLLLLRGDLHRGSQHWAEALGDFRKVLQMDGSNATAELGIGNTWLDQGELAIALIHLNRSLVLHSGNVRGLVSRARAYRLSGEPLGAAADYRTAIDTFEHPKNPLPEYYFEMARALEAAGDKYIGDAVQALDAGLTRLGSLRILENYAIELERKRGNYKAALERLDHIIDRAMRKEALLLTRGDILLETGQLSAAKAAFSAARVAIDALPAKRRQNRMVKQMRSDIEQRLRDPKLVDARE